MDEALAADRTAPPTPDMAVSSAREYPRHWEADVVASDGGVVHLRPILPSDADAIVEFHSRLSARTRYLRHFRAYPQIPPRDLERFTVVDHHARVALVVLLGDEVIAVGRYEGTLGPDGTSVVGPAEATFVVRDDHQNRGLGSILLEHLAAAARERGVRRFAAEVLAENTQMVRVFRNAGFRSAVSSPRGCCIWSSTSTRSGRWRSAAPATSAPKTRGSARCVRVSTRRSERWPPGPCPGPARRHPAQED